MPPARSPAARPRRIVFIVRVPLACDAAASPTVRPGIPRWRPPSPADIRVTRNVLARFAPVFEISRKSRNRATSATRGSTRTVKNTDALPVLANTIACANGRQCLPRAPEIRGFPLSARRAGRRFDFVSITDSRPPPGRRRPDGDPHGCPRSPSAPLRRQVPVNTGRSRVGTEPPVPCRALCRDHGSPLSRGRRLWERRQRFAPTLVIASRAAAKQ